jgi:hypothetical protein
MTTLTASFEQLDTLARHLASQHSRRPTTADLLVALTISDSFAERVLSRAGIDEASIRNLLGGRRWGSGSDEPTSRYVCALQEAQQRGASQLPHGGDAERLLYALLQHNALVRTLIVKISGGDAPGLIRTALVQMSADGFVDPTRIDQAVDKQRRLREAASTVMPLIAGADNSAITAAFNRLVHAALQGTERYAKLTSELHRAELDSAVAQELSAFEQAAEANQRVSRLREQLDELRTL